MDAAGTLSERKRSMYRDALAFGMNTAKQRLPLGLQFRSGIRPQPLACRSVLLVEDRDEVYRYLANEWVSVGLHVSLATYAADAMDQLVHCRADLLVANYALPDSSGWLLTAKARLVSPTPRIWLYAPWPTPHEMAMAQFVGADGLIAHRGDICRLSAVILSRITVLPLLRKRA